MLKILDESTDAFWEKELKSSPVNVSTVDNYDEKTGIFFPLEQASFMPIKKDHAGLFRLVGGALYKVGDK